MRTIVNLNKHPVHPMIVAFPIAFYTLTPIAFAVFNWLNADPFWFRLGYFCNMAGIGTAILAAVPGFLDWLIGIPKDTAAKRRGLIHMSLNVSALVLFIISALSLRGMWMNSPLSVGGPFWLSLVGVILTMAAGYHGWEMIARHKMGVLMTPEQERLEPTMKESRDRRTPLRPRPV